MNRKKLKEILASHADQLVQSRSGAEPPYELPAEDDAELSSLLGVAERIKSTLTPVSPTRRFETDLKRQLLTTAHLRQAEGYKPPNPERDLLILMAIIGFFLSLAGVLLALKLRSQGI
jgi:hypothetical protein